MTRNTAIVINGALWVLQMLMVAYAFTAFA